MSNDFLNRYGNKTQEQETQSKKVQSPKVQSAKAMRPRVKQAPVQRKPIEKPEEIEKIEVVDDIEDMDEVAELDDVTELDKSLNFEQKSDFQPPKSRGGDRMRPDRKNHKLSYIIWGCGVGIVILIVAIILILNQNVTLPDMVGWKNSDATLWATENDITVRYTEEYSDEVESGVIIAQEVEEGEKLRKGDFLELIVSLGPDPSIMVAVPDFTTMTKAEIEQWASDNHMTKVRITTEISQTIPMGELITYTVNDSSVIADEVRRDSPIYIVFSNGNGKDGKVKLPDFTTMTKEQIEAFGLENNLMLEIEELFDETIPKGQVISQSVAAEEEVRAGDAIQIKISKGKEIIIPNFSKYTMEVAQTMASQEGIAVIVEQKYSGTAADRLISQSLSAGSLYEEGDILTLVYSLGNEIIVPSFVGQGVDALNTWIEEYNKDGAKLSSSISYTASNDAPGTILTQKTANTTVGVNAQISVIVSEGKIVYTPDFVAQAGAGYADAVTRESALAICEELGIIATFQESTAGDRLPGEVWEQSIAPGTEINQGTVITLKYNPVTTTVTVPNFIGMTFAQAKQAGYDRIVYMVNDTGGEDVVIQNQSVAAGATVAPGTSVSLGAQPAPIPEDTTGESSDASTG